MEADKKSVRELAREAGLSPTVIQKIRSGHQKSIKLDNFIHIRHACGYHLVLEKKKNELAYRRSYNDCKFLQYSRDYKTLFYSS